MGCSPFFKSAIAASSMEFTNSEDGDTPIVQVTAKPSKQSIIGERYTFPAGILNSVISVSHFSFGCSAWKLRLTIFATSGLISPM